MMITGVQENLFDVSRPEVLRRRVRELDLLIAKALRKNNYDKARALTEEQKRNLQELVDLGESPQIM